MCIRDRGYDTLEAYDGPAGLQLALENDPDLILLDLMLPGMDGFEVCRNCLLYTSMCIRDRWLK